MKKVFQLCMFFVALACCSSCERDQLSISGDQSPMGEVGTTVGTIDSEQYGFKNVQGEVVSLTDGVSVMTLTAQVTNSTIRNILSNIPGTTVSGNMVTVTGIEFKSTTKGISCISPFAEGIIVEYSAKKGDTYPMKGSNKKREVVSRSTTDDYSYIFWNIKVIEVVEPTGKFGIKETRYWANHKFGLVGIQFTIDDGTVIDLPVMTSSDNW